MVNNQSHFMCVCCFFTSPFRNLHKLDGQLSRTEKCVRIRKCKLSLLLFTDDLVVLASLESRWLPRNLASKHALKGFAAACDISGMKISTSKTKVLHLFFGNPVQCSLQVGSVSLKQVKKFKYFGAAFTSAGRQDEDLDVRSGKASAVMQALHHSVVFKWELSKKAKLSVFKSLVVPIFTYGHESLIMTERMQSQMPASEMRFLQKIKGIMMFDKLRNTGIRESLGIESQFFQIERSQLKLFGHVNIMSRKWLPKHTLYPKVS